MLIWGEILGETQIVRINYKVGTERIAWIVNTINNAKYHDIGRD